MARFTYRGFCAPVFTIFNKDLSVNTKIIAEYAKFLCKQDVDGVLVNGTTGEGVCMKVSKRKLVAEEWAKAVKSTKQHLMIQVGGGSLPDVLDLAEHAEKVGANSILCLPELFFKPKSPRELIKYLKPISQAAPNTPLLYYHNAAYSSVHLNMAEFLNEVGDEIPNLQGIKYSANDLANAMAAFETKNKKYAVFLGANALIAPALFMGFDSLIATSLNFIPQYTIGIRKALEEKNLVEARNLQEELIRVMSTINKFGAWVPTMKTAMTFLTPIDAGKARPPLENLNDKNIAEMKQVLKQLSVL